MRRPTPILLLALACARPSPGQAPEPARTPGAPVPEDMVPVAAGEFLMGCNAAVDADCAPAEGAPRRVRVSAFAIGRTEVTAGAYARCVAAGACAKAVALGDCNHGHADRADRPANCVDWSQASAYCAWTGGRLPTEAEWEKAARGTDGRRWPWGNDFPETLGAWRANVGEGLARDLWVRDGWELDAPVGRFPDGASPYGALDMAGNVAEWTADWHADYDASAGRDPAGPAAGTVKAVRGGSWISYRKLVRTSARDWHSPDQWLPHVGFRCALGL
ncbi:MAG: formylglycine-generating enzyme family protein [Deltaproteobacteria bacterium]|nr:formylglycine-generating enzyme family protein [Deltaproteobacteria bacterium]